MTAEKSNVPYDTISGMSVSTQSMFTKCCGCVPIRTGCFILGYLNLTISCLQTLALIGLTAALGVMSHGFDHLDKPLDHPDSSSDAGPSMQLVGLILGVLIIACVTWIAITIACLVGLHKKRPGPIRVYIGFATARFILSFVGFAFLLSSGRTTTQSFITHCVDLGLTAYFIMVYYIYANRLEKERESDVATPAPVNNVYIYPPSLDKSHLVVEEKKGDFFA